MNRIFKDENLQKKFDSDGFVKLVLFTPEEAKELRDFYMTTEEEHTAIGRQFHSTNHTSNSGLIEKVNAYLRQKMVDAVSKHLINFNAMHSNYLVKEPGEGSQTQYHQDWSFVDESRFISFSAWVALEDIDEENGYMEFVTASNRLRPTLRISPDSVWWYGKVMGELDKYKVGIATKAGEGVIFHHSTIHSSPPNKTDKPRVAAVLGMYEAQAELLHFYLKPGKSYNEIGQYKMTLEAFYHIAHNEAPTMGEFQKYVAFDFDQMEADQFRSLMRKALGWRRYTYHTLKRMLKGENS
ncbi:MAG: hypothetical protein JWO06_1627 [Bacteroidota bacterium]|nr:hypothetical protein [Bacteroidota bacterium]